MKFYRFTRETATGEQDVLAWESTYQWARRRAKSYVHMRDEIYVDLVNVVTDKNGVLLLLQGEPPDTKGHVEKSWTITSRGGLKPQPTPKET